MGKLANFKKALDMSESARMARMRDMNMERGYFRGASQSNDALSYFTPDQSAAEAFAKRFPDGQVQEYALKQDRNFRFDGGFTYDQAESIKRAVQANADDLLAEEIYGAILDGTPPALIHQALDMRAGSAKKILADAGYDYIDAGQELFRLHDKGTLRSVDAAFDPAKKDSANLMAGVGGAAVLGGSMLPEESQAAALQDLRRVEAAQRFAERRARKKQYWDNLRNAPLEVLAGINRATVDTLNFLGPDQVNAALQLSGSDARVPELNIPAATQGNFMPEGDTRESVRYLTELYSPL